jgi:hypothetical protein
MRETTSAAARESWGGSTAEEAWREDLEAIGQRLREEDLVSAEQVEQLGSLAMEFERLARHRPAVALPLMSIAFWLVQFERLVRQEAQAAGTLALVRSAVRLTEEEQAILKERLRERFGEEFILRMRVDPSLIGGLVVEVRGQVLDGSVAGKLTALEEHLQATFEERRLFPLEPSITESTEY